MDIRFYLPESLLPSAETRELWRQDASITLLEGGKAAAAQSWIYRTWSTLVEAGCSVELTHEMPDSGCAIALSGTLPLSYRAPGGSFLVDVVADGLPHPSAHLHILQNAAHTRRLPRSCFMPHWPQPGLLPRDRDRGRRLECAAFFGARDNLAAELRCPAWQKELNEQTGVRFDIRGAQKWNDYRDVDVVIAVRDFKGSRQLHKPATKLYNAWLAGVPFIGGTDSAYAAEGELDKDYLVACSPQEVIRVIALLKGDQLFREHLVDNGIKKSNARNAQAITDLWRKLVEQTLPRLADLRAQRSGIGNFCADVLARAALFPDRIFRS